MPRHLKGSRGGERSRREWRGGKVARGDVARWIVEVQDREEGTRTEEDGVGE